MHDNKDHFFFLDGEWLKTDETQTTLQHPNLSHGSGVFENLRAYRTENDLSIFKAEEHYKRLVATAKSISLPLSYSPEQLLQLTYKLLQKNKLKNASIQALIYIDEKNVSHFLLTAQVCNELDEYKNLKLSTLPYDQGFPLGISLVGTNTSSTLAKQQARHQGFDDVLFVNQKGYVNQGTATLFYERDQVLYTSSLKNLFPEVARSTILELCQLLEIDCIEQDFTPEEVKDADGAFWVSTINGIENIASLDTVDFKLEWAESLGHQLFRAHQRIALEITPPCVF
ncbi:MAG: aminotransferase class IV [Aureispira sp.]|nr:aminotransferase class IV [Aureispira sp.]